MPAIPVPDASQPFADFSNAWPKRLPLGKDGKLTLAIEEPRKPWAFERVFFAISPKEADRHVASATLAAANLSFKPDDPTASLALEDSGSFVTRYDDPMWRPGRGRSIGAEHFLVATLTLAHGELAPALERTSFVLYEPKAKPAQAEAHPRGIALLMPGVFGTPEGTLEATVRSLREHGWHVLRMLAQPSRFTQGVTFRVDPDANDEALDAKGAEIAAVMGDRAAECAYAVQGAFEQILAEHAELSGLPRVAIGFSGGAISLPVVVAREPDKYAATVLVGGGAHYWLINAHSTYADMIAAITIEWTTPPTLEQRRRVADAYLRHAPLDSFHTAKALQGKPTLMIQANADSAVAAVLGDVLWERAGKPDRWIHPGEHLPLFISLLKDLPAINDWLDAHVPRLSREAPDAKIPAMPGDNPTPPAKGPQ